MTTTIPETCATCRFCHLSVTPPKCRKRPPVLLPNGVSMWPAVTKADWCGDWDAWEEAE